MGNIRVDFTPTKLSSTHVVKAEFKTGGVTYNVTLDLNFGVTQVSYAIFRGPITVDINHEKLALRLQEMAGVRLGRSKEQELIEALEESVPAEIEIDLTTT